MIMHVLMMSAQLIFLCSMTSLTLAHRIDGAPHRKLLHMGSDIVNNQYLVVFKNDVFDVDAKADELVRTTTSCNVKFTYNLTLKGFALRDCIKDELHSILDDEEIEVAMEVSTYKQEPLS